MKIVFCVALALAAWLPAAADVNVTGNWSGTFTSTGPNGDTHDSTALLVLKQDGNQITGTAGPNQDERYPITKGTIDGNKIVFEVAGGEHTIHFELTVAEDRIQGEARGATDGGQWQAKLDVKRSK